MYVTTVTSRRLGDIQSPSCYFKEALTGKPCEERIAAQVEDCTAQNFKAGQGRLTMEQAREQCKGTIDAVIKSNGGTADPVLPSAKDLTKWVVLGLFGVAAVGIAVGIATR